MRTLSFLFAALLGIALAMMGPVLAGPRPEAPQAPILAAEPPVERAEIAAFAPLEPTVTEPTATRSEESLSIEQISRSILEAIGADAA
jgi:hypothetical protein